MSTCFAVDFLGCVDDSDGNHTDNIGMGFRTSGNIELKFWDKGGSVTSLQKPGRADSTGYPVVVLSNKILASFGSGDSLRPRGVSAFNRFAGYEIWHYEVGPSCQITSIWDIDRDGKVEIAISCASADDGVMGDGYNHNGTTTSDSYFYTIVIDEDGAEELTVDYSVDGEARGTMRSFFVDLNKDGKYEILALEGHNARYPGNSHIHLLDSSTGSVLKTYNGWENMSWSDPVIADINSDGLDEVVVSRQTIQDTDRSGHLGYYGQYILGPDLSLIASKGELGVVQFANDVDGDGEIELAIAASNILRILDGNLSEKWRFLAGGHINTAIVSDMDDNGKNEIIVLADKLYVLEGGIEYLDYINVVINQIPSPPANFPKVKCYVFVTDKADKPIKGLTEKNFSVEEDGIKQAPIGVVPVGKIGKPISVVLALDYSSSMHNKGAISHMESAARSFIGLLEAEDRGAIVKFSTVVEVTQPLTINKALMNEAIDTDFWGINGATSLYDAIYESARVVAGKEGRKAVVIVTDAEDTSSVRPLKRAIDYAVASDVPVFIVALGNVYMETIKQIAGETGGHWYKAPDREDLMSLYELVSQTLKDQYEITYATGNLNQDGGIREVKIFANYSYLTGEDSGIYQTQDIEARAWDVNKDRKVDILDLIIVSRYFGQTIQTDMEPNPDMNGDRNINILDVILVVRHFGEVYPPPDFPKHAGNE